MGAEGRGQQRANNQSDSGRRTGDYETETQKARTAEVARPQSVKETASGPRHIARGGIGD